MIQLRILINCVGCVMALEARLRGYRVHAAEQYFTGKLDELSHHPFWAWIDKNSGKKCEGVDINAQTARECIKEIENIVKNGQRYNFVYYTEHILGGKNKSIHHVISIDRDNNGVLRFYDPQSDSLRQDELIEGNIEAVVNLKNAKLPLQILKADDKINNSEFAGVALTSD